GDSGIRPRGRSRGASIDRMQDDSRTRVVIVGGGFAGVACASLLGEDDRVDVTLIDQNGYHQFQPLLYQVATAELAGQDMTFEHTEIFRRQPSVKTVQGEVSSADIDHHSVTLADGRIVAGDYLVLAAGAQSNFFNTPGARDYAFPLYSLRDARR